MASDWKTLTIDAIVEDVYDGPHATPEKTTSGPVFLGIWNLVDGRVDLSETEHLSEEDFPRWTRRVLPRAGDIVFSYETKLGCAAMIPHGLRCCLGRRMALIRPLPDKVDGRFLLYSFLGPPFQEEIRARTVPGSTVERIALMEFPRYPLRLPPLPEQRAIAAVLGALDDKIEVNRKAARVLEGIARAVFTSWFVDFDPVRHRAVPTTSGSPAPLPADLADLFPKRLVDSPIGEVPEGWRVGTIGDHLALQRGTTYKSSLKGLPGPVLLGLASIRRNGGFRDDNLSTYGGSSPAHMILSPGELYVSLKDVTQSADLLGAIARVPRHVPRGRLTQDTVKLTFKADAMSPNIVYAALLRQEYREYCRGRSTGTTNLGLSREDFLSYPIVEPTQAVQAEFDRMADALDHRSAACELQSRTLSALRDALLPKLISGELRIADAEKIIGRMA